jgi:hypothetical protein
MPCASSREQAVTLSAAAGAVYAATVDKEA